jgi:biotin transport system substrate-specific component
LSYALPRPRAAVLADLVPGTYVRDAALVLGGAGLTGIAAQVSIPLPNTPVPVTGQTFAVLLVGAGLGWYRALASMAIYVLAGFAGMPWFAEHSSGVPKATVGYLIGFVVAAALVGALAGRGGDRTPLRTVATMTLGTIVIYAFGVPFLMNALDVDFAKAWELGVRPFLVGDGLKVLLAAGLLPAAWWLVRQNKDEPDSGSEQAG